MAFGLSTPIVEKTRSMLARRSPARTILELLDAVVARSRAAGTPLAAAIFDDYITRTGDGDTAQWLLEPFDLPVEAAAELAISCARDCLAFIQNLDFRNERTLQDAETHLRGLLNAGSLLNSLVLKVPSAGFHDRLFGRNSSPDAIVRMLNDESMYAFIFRLAQHERVSSHGEKARWTDDEVVNALVKLSAAALVDKSHRDGMVNAFDFISRITEEYLHTPFSAVIRVLDVAQYGVDRFLYRGLLELGNAAHETYLSGDVQRAIRIDGFARALSEAYAEANIGIFQEGRTLLHVLQSMSTADEAFEVWQYVRLGTLLAEAGVTFQLSDVAEDLIEEFVSLFGNREASCAHDPALWHRAVERCEAMNFKNVAGTLALLRRAATVQPEGALVRAAKDLCSVASPNGEPAIVLAAFLDELRVVVAERVDSRYHRTQTPLTAAERWNEQLRLVVRELYDALPSFLRRRVFQDRLFRFANSQSEAIDPQWKVIFSKAHETLNAYIADQRATAKHERPEDPEPRPKRRRKELEKEIER